jgi:hypothetical protein
MGLPVLVRLKCWCTYASTSLVYPQLLSPLHAPTLRQFYQAGSRVAFWKPPNAQSPFAQMQHYPHWGGVASTSYGDITPRSLLVRTHSPIPMALRYFGLSLDEKSLQVATSPCCHLDLPDVISANLSLDASSLAPAVSLIAFTCFFISVIGLPHGLIGSASRFIPRIRLLVVVISRLQIFLYVEASKFARLPGRSYRCVSTAGQPRLLRPGRTCFVTSACTGYANRPKTGN